MRCYESDVWCHTGWYCIYVLSCHGKWGSVMWCDVMQIFCLALFIKVVMPPSIPLYLWCLSRHYNSLCYTMICLVKDVTSWLITDIADKTTAHTYELTPWRWLRSSVLEFRKQQPHPSFALQTIRRKCVHSFPKVALDLTSAFVHYKILHVLGLYLLNQLPHTLCIHTKRKKKNSIQCWKQEEQNTKWKKKIRGKIAWSLSFA